MTEDGPTKPGVSRRGLLRKAGAGVVAAGAAGVLPASIAAPARAQQAPAHPGPFNILLIVTDQERYFRPGELPRELRLPGRERLMRKGITFENHQINSCVCTPSRSVLYTGLHIQQTRMFDNTNFPWIGSMSTELRTVGDLMREAGYYTAYKGKWHLTKEFETTNRLAAPTKIFTKEMEAYGFSDYFGIGDIIGHTRGGYLHDGITAAMSVNWLRGKGKAMTADGKPWFLAVNLVNPHDVMFYDTDAPGQKVQSKDIIGEIERDPRDALYAAQWRFDLPASNAEPLDAPGRPVAHAEFIRCHDVMVGCIDPEPERWRRRHNYYLNCLRDVDRSIVALLDELEALGLASNTIIVFTSDHGDIDGAHQLHAKGATAYREQNTVPLVVVHPAYPGGKRCKAVTSHLDLAPTFVGLTHGTPEKKASITRDLPGKDLSFLLAAPEKASFDALRDGALFNYNMLAYLDADFMVRASALLMEARRNPGSGPARKPADRLKEAGIRPNLLKRGAIRAVFDGRYMFARYFSPKQHNRPNSIEDLFRFNDVELFDLQDDPHQVKNLARDRARSGDLIVAMNGKLNRLIEREVGEDVGQMLPGGIEAGWAITPENFDP